ncbi:MAG: glycoside hydrolase family 32 protein [Verrucomicrobia bacterium]|nr:glycoside hydrolase family 32 protein [Verrucomicrobiota bacterium]
MQPPLTRRGFLKTAGLGAIASGLSPRLLAEDKSPAAPAPKAYDEEYRPQFHFSAATGFLADPNMTVYYAGEYHLGFFGCHTIQQSAPAHWGHAVSPDLIHWRELGVAVPPDPGHGDGVWSGGGIVDWKNTSGLQTGTEKVLVAFYSKTRAGICLVYCNDRGRTWTKYPANPVLPVSVTGSWDDRDPSVFWHEPTRRWIMLLTESGLARLSFYGSIDLKKWDRLSSIEKIRVDCPDIFDLPVDGEPHRRKWVLWASFFHPWTGRYMVGHFDGTRFIREDEIRRLDWGRNSFSARTWRDEPKGRTIQIAWLFHTLSSAEGRLPGMPFSQQMSIPCELSLKTFPDGLRLCRWPVRELESLRTRSRALTDLVVTPSQSKALASIPEGLADLEVEFELDDAAEFGLRIRGETISYNVLDRLIQVRGESGPLEPVQGRISLRILVDRMSLEVFGNGGRLSMTNYFTPLRDECGIEIYACRGSVRLVSAKVHELRSIWRES